MYLRADRNDEWLYAGFGQEARSVVLNATRFGFPIRVYVLFALPKTRWARAHLRNKGEKAQPHFRRLLDQTAKLTPS
jgi:hypothetical protein